MAPSLRSASAVLAGLVLALTGACGYRFVRSGETLPEGVRTLCAPVMVNHTSESALETYFTQSLRERLIRAGVLGATGACDAALVGEILGVGAAPTILGTDPSGVLRLASYRTNVVVRLRMEKGGQTLRATEVAAAEDFLPGQELLDSETNRQEALRRLADDLMREAYDRLTVPDF